ncbi:hypothetical protein LTR28_002490 [Elasticomyces elasticus]|nr:hypothetical protein LTR28_002490 [Elasticomyces elasticus]
MKYLTIPDFEVVASALNFSKADIHVIGGCDVYATKAASDEKKLYKSIEDSLESQYQSLVKLSASLPQPTQTHAVHHESLSSSNNGKKNDSPSKSKSRAPSAIEIPQVDLSRASPFGPLSKVSARRTFTYLIATLNASHPDYEFSYVLRPNDFRKEISTRRVMAEFDNRMENLRPGPVPVYATPPSYAYLSNPMPAVLPTSGSAATTWGPQMWQIIDREMDLRACEKYSYQPEEDPFEGEEGAIWSVNYFFYNKARKRVCYLHLRGLSVISHSPVRSTFLQRSRQRAIQRQNSNIGVGEGAEKRAQYWLGSREDVETYGEDDDDETMVYEDPDEDEVDIDSDEAAWDGVREELEDGNYGYEDDDEDEFVSTSWTARRQPRALSEGVMEGIEL